MFPWFQCVENWFKRLGIGALVIFTLLQGQLLPNWKVDQLSKFYPKLRKLQTQTYLSRENPKGEFVSELKNLIV